MARTLARDRAVAAAAAIIPITEAKARGPLTGIWLSTYTYPSSSRGKTYSAAHHVVVIQRGGKVRARSIGSPSKLLMEMTAEGNVLTGTWRGHGGKKPTRKATTGARHTTGLSSS